MDKVTQQNAALVEEAAAAAESMEEQAQGLPHQSPSSASAERQRVEMHSGGARAVTGMRSAVTHRRPAGVTSSRSHQKPDRGLRHGWPMAGSIRGIVVEGT